MTGGNNPLRVICDSKLRIPLDCQLVKTAKEIPTIVACEEGVEGNADLLTKSASLKTAGLEILQLPLTSEGSLDLAVLMQILGQRKIDSVLIEGGGEINFSALKAGIVNKIYAFVAPKLFGGGSAAKSPVSGEGIAAVEEAFLFKLTKIRQFEEDLLIEYEK